MSRACRRSLAVAAGVVLGLAAFELALQAAALALWVTNGPAPSALPADPGRVVLCVGDSFTYGMGAREQEGCYPVQLERRLSQDGGTWTVVNGGWPGQSSREVLLRLAGQLEAFRPWRVYVMVGYNDAWKLPDPVAGGTPRAVGFPWTWRTGRLLALAAHALRPRPPFLGTWHDRHSELTFEPGGRLLTPVEELRWVLEGDALWLLTPDLGRVRVDWRREGDRLHLACALWGGPKAMERGSRDDARAPGSAGEASGRGTDPGAALVRRSGVVSEALLGLGRLARGDAGRRAHLQRLQELAGERGDPRTRTELLRALQALGEDEAALGLACRWLEEDPRQFGAWGVLARAGMRPEHRQSVETSLRLALRAAAGEPAAIRVRLHRALALLLRDRAPADALRHVAAAALLDGWGGPLVELLRGQRELLTEEVFARVVDELEPSAEERARLLALWRRSRTGGGHVAVLETHLRRIVEACRAAGAEPVLLGYPSPLPEVEAAVGAVVAAERVGYLALAPVFEAALAGRPRSALFAPDGHCNDAGYALLSETVAADVTAALRNE